MNTNNITFKQFLDENILAFRPSPHQKLLTQIQSVRRSNDPYKEAEALSMVDELVFDKKAPMKLKIQAIVMLDRILGTPKDTDYTEKDVNDYINHS